MEYKGKQLTFDNIRSVLKDFSVDVQDEVRLAYLDGIDLIPYINKNSKDPFKLQQIRLGLKQGIDTKFFENLNGENILKVRRYVQKNLLSAQILDIVEKETSQEAYGYLIDLNAAGKNVGLYDFSIIPEKLVKAFADALKLSVDISPLNDGVNYSEDFVRACIEIRSFGFEIKEFTEDGWYEDTVVELANYTGASFFKKLKEVLSADCSPEFVEPYALALRSGITDERLYEKDEKGVPLFMPSQIYFIVENFLAGIDIEDLLDSSLTIDEMYAIKSAELEKKNRKLKGVLF